MASGIDIKIVTKHIGIFCQKGVHSSCGGMWWYGLPKHENVLCDCDCHNIDLEFAI